jgi:hypothetical protein
MMPRGLLNASRRFRLPGLHRRLGHVAPDELLPEPPQGAPLEAGGLHHLGGILEGVEVHTGSFSS